MRQFYTSNPLSATRWHGTVPQRGQLSGSQRGSIGEHGLARLLPPISELRSVSEDVAKAVARQAQADGVADPCPPDELDARIQAFIWEPRYRPYRKTD